MGNPGVRGEKTAILLIPVTPAQPDDPRNQPCPPGTPDPGLEARLSTSVDGRWAPALAAQSTIVAPR